MLCTFVFLPLGTSGWNVHVVHIHTPLPSLISRHHLYRCEEHLDPETEVVWEQLVACQTMAQWFPFREKVEEKKESGRCVRGGWCRCSKTTAAEGWQGLRERQIKGWTCSKTWGLRWRCQSLKMHWPTLRQTTYWLTEMEGKRKLLFHLKTMISLRFACLFTNVIEHRAFMRHMTGNQCRESLYKRGGRGACSQCGSTERVS